MDTSQTNLKGDHRPELTLGTSHTLSGAKITGIRTTEQQESKSPPNSWAIRSEERRGNPAPSVGIKCLSCDFREGGKKKKRSIVAVCEKYTTTVEPMFKTKNSGALRWLKKKCLATHWGEKKQIPQFIKDMVRCLAVSSKWKPC